MGGQPKTLAGPAFIAAVATDIMGTPAAGTYYEITQISVVNVGAASSFSLFIGATGGSAAGTQVMGGALAVGANSREDWYPRDMTLANTQFLSGIAADASRLTILVNGRKCVSSP